MINTAYLNTLSLMTFAIICNGHSMDYTISSNEDLNYYYYPTPQGVKFHEPTLARQFNMFEQYYQPYHYQNHHQNHHHHHYEQRQHQNKNLLSTSSLSLSPSSSSSSSSSSIKTISKITKEFTSPMLENVAFTMALSRQGYAIINDGIMSSSSSLIGAQQQQQQEQQHQRSNEMMRTASSQMDSQNVKLPLPLGVTPITFAPFPLQAGAPYSRVPGLTSYGTPYPQRRR